MRSLAVLLTCHNRKEKTLACLKHLYESEKDCSFELDMEVYVTDDGSDDGTYEAIRDLHPDMATLMRLSFA